MNKNKKASPKKACDELPILFRGLMNFSPQCPWDKVQKIASMVDIQKKNQFIQRYYDLSIKLLNILSFRIIDSFCRYYQFLKPKGSG